MPRDTPPPGGEESPRPPVWARLMTPAGFAYFVNALERDMHQRGLAADVDMESGVMRVGGRAPVFGLTNLAQLCLSAPLDEWDGIIRDHFDNLPVDEPAYGSHPPLADVHEHLRVRLFSSGTDGLGESVMRDVAEGIVEVLVIDEPSRVRTVSREDADRWGMAHDDLLELGRRLVHEHEAVVVDAEWLDDRTAITVVHGPSHFVATHALWPLELCTGPAPDGLIIAMPTRDVVFIHEIRDVGVVSAINALGRSAPAMFRAGPGSLSPDVYWWFEGTSTIIPMVVGDDRVLSVSPPAALITRLNALPETDEG